MTVPPGRAPRTRQLRITFDRNIRWRRDRLTLDAGDDGKRLLPEDQILMEVKTLGACPLWLCRALSAQHIYPASFSKYGACYKEMCREANAPARMTQFKGGASLCLTRY